MKQDEKEPTASQADSSMLISGDELTAANSVCASLTTAADAAERLATALAKDGFNPAILPGASLQTLPVVHNAELRSVINDMRTALIAAYRGGDPTKLISHWLYFMYRGAIPLLQKKCSIALAEGNHAAAQTFAAVFDALPPRDKIEHPNGWADMEAEAKRLAQSTTPGEIIPAIIRAFRLDADATKALNDGALPNATQTAVLVGEQAKQLASAAARNAARLEAAQTGGKVSAATRQANLSRAIGKPVQNIMETADGMRRSGEQVKNIITYIAGELGLTNDAAKSKWYRHIGKKKKQV